MTLDYNFTYIQTHIRTHTQSSCLVNSDTKSNDKVIQPNELIIYIILKSIVAFNEVK